MLLKSFFLTGDFSIKKKARGGLQSFTCGVVLEAVINSGNIVCLYDVSQDDCSIDYTLLNKDHNLDILIITHYQGIPNKNYEKIANFCNENNILLLEDCSHGAESEINGIKIGTLSAAFIESFAWDKPYTSLQGGSLKINNIPTDFEFFLRDNFFKLPQEDDKKGKNDIFLVFWLLQYTKPERFHQNLDYSLFFNYPWIRYLYPSILTGLKTYRKLFSLFIKILNRLHLPQKNELERLAPIKIAFIEEQRHYYKQQKWENENYCFDEIESFTGIKTLISKNVKIVWNRFSFIDLEGKSKDWFIEHNIQAGHYNWPHTLNQIMSTNNKTCLYMSEFNNSEYLCTHIINAPIWQLMIKKDKQDKND